MTDNNTISTTTPEKQQQLVVMTTKSPSDDEVSLTIVSMNLAGCQPSQAADWDWNQQRSIDTVKQIILEQNPHVILLQESPGGMKQVEQVFPGYQALGATYSHADQVVLLVQQGIQAERVLLAGDSMPAVMGLLTFQERRLLIASVHLAPFQQEFIKRKAQVTTLLEKANAMNLPLILAGDMNMRVTEDDTMEHELQLKDVWKLAGSDPATKWTWDTKDHRAEGGSFNQYYGSRTRQYNTRYDRIYIHSSPEMSINKVAFQLIANLPITTNNRHFLSDHFGMSSQIKLDWKKEE